MGMMVFPSVKTMKEASSPVKKSSIMMRSPAAPKIFLVRIASIASSALSKVRAGITPLPAASPSALITEGMPFFLR